jgi:hypothetical protein
MTYAEDVLDLPICPKCLDTKHVGEMGYAIMGNFFGCSQCKIEWSKHRVRDMKTGDDLTDSLFPDRLNRPKSYMELSGNKLVREPRPWEWWK